MSAGFVLTFFAARSAPILLQGSVLAGPGPPRHDPIAVQGIGAAGRNEGHPAVFAEFVSHTLDQKLDHLTAQHIEIHNRVRSTGHVRVAICFTAVGMIDLPIEEELTELIPEIRKNSLASIGAWQ